MFSGKDCDTPEVDLKHFHFQAFLWLSSFGVGGGPFSPPPPPSSFLFAAASGDLFHLRRVPKEIFSAPIKSKDRVGANGNGI